MMSRNILKNDCGRQLLYLAGAENTRAPLANAICERVLGTLQRECLDFVMPLTANDLRHLLQGWVQHYNTGRPSIGGVIISTPR